MKKKYFLSILVLVVSVGLAGMFQSFKANATPAPEPASSTYKFIADHWYDTHDLIWRDYYEIKFSVYSISHDGFGGYNEGPFSPYTGNNEISYFLSQWNVTYSTSTYARIWYKKVPADSWILAGDIHMDTFNNTTLKSGTSIVSTFTIDMQMIPAE